MGWPSSIRYDYPHFTNYKELKETLLRRLKDNERRPIKPRIRERKEQYKELLRAKTFKWVYLKRDYYSYIGARLYPDRIEYYAWAAKPWAVFFPNDTVVLPNPAWLSSWQTERILGITIKQTGGGLYMVGNDEKYYALKPDNTVFVPDETNGLLPRDIVREKTWRINHKMAADARVAAKPFIDYVCTLKGIGVDTDRMFYDANQYQHHEHIGDWLRDKKKIISCITSTEASDLYSAYCFFNAAGRYSLAIRVLWMKTMNTYLPPLHKAQELAYYAFGCYEEDDQPMGVPIRDFRKRVKAS